MTVGSSTNVQDRYKQHGRMAPVRMRHDAAAHQPFTSHFHMTVVAHGLDKWAAKEMEPH